MVDMCKYIGYFVFGIVVVVFRGGDDLGFSNVIGG